MGTVEECEFAFMASGLSFFLRGWFMDICASRHLKNHRQHIFDYRPLKNVEFVNGACEGGLVNVVGIGNLRVKQVINVVENECILKDVGYSPKCRRNFVASTKAQRASINIIFEGSGTKMKASYCIRSMLVGDSKDTGITELCNLVPVSTGQPEVTFFNADEDESMNHIDVHVTQQ